jgi:riboflavin biosynthesis pyrimidine reductase
VTRTWREYSEPDLSAVYAWPQQKWSRLNLVCDANGSIVGVTGNSDSLTSAHDRWLLKFIRSQANVVVVGAASVRAEGWHIPKSGTLMVVSTGSFDSFPKCPDTSRVTIGLFEEIVTSLDDVTHWLCEGGESLSSQLLERDLIDEICLTFSGVAPSAAGLTLPAWMREVARTHFECISSIPDDENVFTIWRRGSSS